MIEWVIGCEVLMRDVSTDYTGCPTNIMGEEIVEENMKIFLLTIIFRCGNIVVENMKECKSWKRLLLFYHLLGLPLFV